MTTGTGTAGVLRTSAPQVTSYDRMLAGMAKTMWLPLIVMGFMIVGISFIVGIINAGWVADWFAASKATREAATSGSELVSLNVKSATVGAFLPGFKFLGLGMLFSGIVMALANIINTLRDGGARVQEAVGVEVRALKKPLAGRRRPRRLDEAAGGRRRRGYRRAAGDAGVPAAARALRRGGGGGEQLTPRPELAIVPRATCARSPSAGCDGATVTGDARRRRHPLGQRRGSSRAGGPRSGA